MERKKKAARMRSGQHLNLLPYDKGNEYFPKRQVRLLFLAGNKLTAREINQIVGFNDARKVISDLRHKDGMRIKDIRLNDGCKLYWLEPDGQPTLF